MFGSLTLQGQPGIFLRLYSYTYIHSLYTPHLKMYNQQTFFIKSNKKTTQVTDDKLLCSKLLATGNFTMILSLSLQSTLTRGTWRLFGLRD